MHKAKKKTRNVTKMPNIPEISIFQNITKAVRAPVLRVPVLSAYPALEIGGTQSSQPGDTPRTGEDSTVSAPGTLRIIETLLIAAFRYVRWECVLQNDSY